ncbi:MAG: sulfatase-like hydrolase/transferase [Planctomycetota bacterium]
MKFLNWLIALVCFIGSIQSGYITAGEPHGNSKQPNIVLILIDDLSHYGVTAYGANRLSEKRENSFTNVQFETPNIDKLASRGLMCNRAYAYPLCEATRIALMSGQYNSRNFLKPKAQHSSEITFGDTFRKAGYATGMFGKWKQTRGTKKTKGKDYIFEFGWDEFCCFDVVGEGQRFINPNLVVNGKVENYEGRTDLDPITGRRWYGPDICNRRVLDFIERNKENPFFLYYPMLLVHDEHKPTPDTVPKAEFDSCDESKKFDDLKYFPDMLSYMDKMIGNVAQKIKDCGLLENTLIVVMGDNGTKEPFTHLLPDGSKFQGNKGATKENGLHVPLIFAMPGTVPFGKGRVRSYDGLTDVVDIYPTLAEAAGIQIENRHSIDGVSFWQQIVGRNSEEHRDTIYTWYNENFPATNLTHVVRYAFDKNFKRYAPHDQFPEGRFFDLRSDPFEETGRKKVMLRWKHYHKEGLDLNELNAEQRLAFKKLGEVIDQHEFVPATGLEIEGPNTPVKKDTVVKLRHSITPLNATRRNVIWESSDPEIAEVNKFGELTAKNAGTTNVTVYSWDDAKPLASGKTGDFAKSGIQARLTISVID